MGRKLRFKQRDNRADTKDWLLLIAYIAAKRTHEPLFTELFDKLLREEEHLFHRQAEDLQTRYDFTPLKMLDGTSENDKSDQSRRTNVH